MRLSPMPSYMVSYGSSVINVPFGTTPEIRTPKISSMFNQSDSSKTWSVSGRNGRFPGENFADTEKNCCTRRIDANYYS